jgi:mitotic spindle assembly checkpoint protein MAD1
VDRKATEIELPTTRNTVNMDGEQLSGQSTRIRNATSLRTTAIKRDSLMAELERGELSRLSFRNSKRVASYSVSQPDAKSLYQTPNIQQRSANNAPKLSPHASLERQLAALTTTKNDLEKKLREKDVVIDRLEKDRRWLAEIEKEEREERERERIEWDEAQVGSRTLYCFHRLL